MTKAQNISYYLNPQQSNDLWNLSINNEAELRIVYLHGTVTSKTTGVVYEASTSQFQLPKGNQILRSYLLNKINVIQSTLAQTDGQLPLGTYEFKTELLDYYNNQKLGFTTAEVIIADETLENGNDSLAEKSKPFMFNFKGDISSQYSYDFKSDFNSNEYTRLNLNPSITIYDVPISADIFVTTNNNGNQNSNYFNVHFDYYKFQQILLQKTLTKLEQNPNVDLNKERVLAIKEEKLNDNIKNYKEWKEKLEDPELKTILRDLEKIDALKTVVNNKELKEKHKSIKSIEKRFKNTSLEDIKEPLKSLNKSGINIDNLSTIIKDKEIVKLINSKGEKFLDQIAPLKNLKDPQQFIQYAQTQLKSDIKLDNIVSFDKDEIQAEGIKQGKDVLSEITPIDKSTYDKLLKVYEAKDWQEFTELDEKQLDQILNKFSSKDLSKVKDLIDKGINDSNQLKDIGSWKDVEEMINFKKEYGAILDKYENLLEDKKSYKSARKVKDKIDKIEGLSVRDMIKDPKVAKAFVNDFDVLSQSENILSDFKAIELGDVYPVYNQLMLNGVKLKGGNVEWAPKKLYVGVTSGKINNQINNFQDTTQTTLTLEKILYAAKFGIGNKKENHLHFTYLGGLSKVNNDIELYNTTGSNHVVGFDGSYLMKERVKMEGEFNYSIFNPDRSVNNETFQSLQQTGFAYQLKGSLLVPNGEIYVQSEQVSEAYSSYGLPYIIKDRWTIESGVIKSLFMDQLQTNIYFKSETTISGFQEKIKAYSGNINVTYKPKGKPYINVFYNLLHLNSEGAEIIGIKNIAHNYSVSTGLSYTIKKAYLTSQATYSFQFLNTQNITTIDNGTISVNFDNYYGQKAHVVTLSQQLQLKKVQISALGQINQFNVQSLESNNNLYSIESTVGVPLFKNKLKTLTGVQYSKLGTSAKMSYFTQFNFGISKFLNFNLNVKYDHISDKQENSSELYQGLTFYGRLNVNF